MLRALTALIERNNGKSALDQRDLDSIGRLLVRTEVYAKAIEQLTAPDVEGCVKGLQLALVYKAAGNKQFAAGRYEQAVGSYSDSLQWLPVAHQPLEASKIHSNRAQAILKLASAAAAAAATDDGAAYDDSRICRHCRAAASGAGLEGPVTPAAETAPAAATASAAAAAAAATAQHTAAASKAGLNDHALPTTATAAAAAAALTHGSGPTCFAKCRVHALATAAMEDCTAALESDHCPTTLISKVLFRRATAQLLLHNHQAAAADAQAAAAAALQAGDNAACKDIQMLQLRIQAAVAAAAAAAECSNDTSRQQQQQSDAGGNVTAAAAAAAAAAESLGKLFLQNQPAAAAASCDKDAGLLPYNKQQQQQQQRQQQQPPCGPSLHQLDLLLLYQQQQAVLWWQQQQQQQGTAAGPLNHQQQTALGSPKHQQQTASGRIPQQQIASDPFKQQQQQPVAFDPPKLQRQQQQQHESELSIFSPQPVMRCQYSIAAGRHVTAAADIAPGTILLAEMPLAAVTVKTPKAYKQRQQQDRKLTDAGGTSSSSSSGVCEWCFETVGIAPWYCTHCPLVTFCSLRCRNAAAAAGGGGCHVSGGIECGKPWSRLLPDHARLASRCMAAAAGARCVADPEHQCQQQQQDQGLDVHQIQQLRVQLFHSLQQNIKTDAINYHALSAAAAAGNVDSGSLHSASSGSSNTSDRQQQLQEQIVLSHLTAHILQQQQQQITQSSSTSHHCNHPPKQQQQWDTTPAAAAVFSCLGQLVLNGIAIQPLLTSSNSSSSSSGSRRGLGLYPVTALFNHDCDPNCNIRFDGRQLLLVCVHGASAGHPLTISYGPQLGAEPTVLRQQLLLNQYGFYCCCCSCIEGARKGSGLHLVEAAAAAGLACGSSSSSSSECGRGVIVQGDARNVEDLVGVVGVYPGAVRCVGCGRLGCIGSMSSSILTKHKLTELSSAAAAADQAVALMIEYENQIEHGGSSNGPASTQQQQQRQVHQALDLLQHTTAVRQRHLHKHNRLLGYSHHQTAAATAAAAAAAASQSTARSVLRAVALLDCSFNSTTAADVGNVVVQLIKQFDLLVHQLRSCQCSASNVPSGTAVPSSPPSSPPSSSSSSAAAEALLSAPVVMAASRSDLQSVINSLGRESLQNSRCTCFVSNESIDQGTGSSSSCRSTDLQGYLIAALQHLAASVSMLEDTMPDRSLGTAVEQLSAAAAMAALLTLRQQQQRMLRSGSADRLALTCAFEGSSDEQSCSCRCSALLQIGMLWLEKARAVVHVHLGTGVGH